MFNRRDFIKTGLGVSTCGAAFLASQRAAYGQFPMFPPSPAMTPFVDPLPIPGVLRPSSFPVINGKVTPRYEVPMLARNQKLHRDLPPTPIWGYWGVYPGPTIEVRQGKPVAVRWVNNLPPEHIFQGAIDPTLHGAEPGTPAVRTVVHLHGARVFPENDGHPEAWFTKDFVEKGQTFKKQLYYYPNDQPSTMLWYHDHTIAITRLNVVAGLAGLYFIRGEEDQELRLPADRYEIPLVLQDKRFNADGSIFYPTQGLVPQVHPNWQPDYLGDVGLVNGKVWPFLRVEARKYRFRILNAANTTFFRVRLDAGGGTFLPFVQIGADLGFLPAPVSVEALLLAPAERADVIVDFSGMEGAEITMTNDAPSFFPIGPPPPVLGPATMMRFQVVAASGPDRSRIPIKLPAEPPLKVADAVRTRTIVMSEEVEVVQGIPLPTLLLLEQKMYDEPIITRPRGNTTEIWRYVNAAGIAHPQHIHLAHEQVLDRQPYDFEHFMMTGQIVATGPRVPAAPNERNAPKDTIRVDMGTITRVLAKFDLPTGRRVNRGDRLEYVHHCHMLEHEDNEMMRPFEVIVDRAQNLDDAEDTPDV